MKVTVLYGGPSDERDISLQSGQAVIDGLKTAGHDVFPSDISPTNLTGLERDVDVIFPVLHGQFGESGELQEILEKVEQQRGIPFVGSGSRASRLGMNKVNTKIAWEKAQIPTPRWQLITSSSVSITPDDPLWDQCVVKAIDNGSSIDVYLCKSRHEAESALASVLAKYGKALVEQFIEGMELTVGILEEAPLPPIRIVHKRAFFDKHAKYNECEHRFDINLPAARLEQIQALALKAHQVIGCRDLSRLDIMLDSAQNAYFLEINTLPGFTSKSLLPDAARHAGISFSELTDRLVRRAASRRRKL